MDGEEVLHVLHWFGWGGRWSADFWDFKREGKREFVKQKAGWLQRRPGRRLEGRTWVLVRAALQM